MKKNLFILLLVPFILFKVNKPQANAEEFKSLIHDNPGNYYIESNLVNPDLAFDKNEETIVSFSGYHASLKIIFKKPVNIHQVYTRYTSDTNTFRRIITSANVIYGIPRMWSNGLTSVNFNNVIAVELFKSDGIFYLQELDLFGEVIDIVYPQVTDINYVVDEDRVTFSWLENFHEEFTGIEIYKEGQLIQTLSNNVSNYSVGNLSPNTTYTFDFVAMYGNARAEKSTVTITTKAKIIEEVKEVKVQAKHNRVDLSWQLPEQEDFNHVTIYRKTIEELKEIETSSLIHEIFTNKVYAEEAGEYDPLFETNGTYFNDLTVKPRSEYEYKLTTVTADGQESQGVYVTAQTPEEPDPQIVGGGYTETENGDYLYTWTEPTEGEVKIIVGGEQYATVPASQGEITIPAEDMEYIFGKPDVSLIPISQYGKEGMEYNPTNPLKNINLPFDASGLLKSGFSLLTIVGPFVLLALSFIFVPRLIRVIKQSAENRKVRGGIR